MPAKIRAKILAAGTVLTALVATNAAWAVPTGKPEVTFECDDVLVAVGQENAFPWIERDIGIEFDQTGMPIVDRVTMASTRGLVSTGTRRSTISSLACAGMA